MVISAFFGGDLAFSLVEVLHQSLLRLVEGFDLLVSVGVAGCEASVLVLGVIQLLLEVFFVVLRLLALSSMCAFSC